MMKTWIAAMSMGVASIGAVLLGIFLYRRDRASV